MRCIGHKEPQIRVLKCAQLPPKRQRKAHRHVDTAGSWHRGCRGFCMQLRSEPGGTARSSAKCPEAETNRPSRTLACPGTCPIEIQTSGHYTFATAGTFMAWGCSAPRARSRGCWSGTSARRGCARTAWRTTAPSRRSRRRTRRNRRATICREPEDMLLRIVCDTQF